METNATSAADLRAPMKAWAERWHLFGLKGRDT